MTKNKRYTYLNYSKDGYIGSFYENDKPLTNKEVWDILNEQEEEIEYLEKKIKENEWHWNTIDEDRDVWHYKCKQAEEKVKELKDENEQLKQDKFICLDCKYCGYTEIGCLCEKQDHWEDFKNECNDFKELKY